MKSLELPTIDEPLIERVHDRIVETFDPEAIYLFGSAARGESRYGSDLDLLVVMELPFFDAIRDWRAKADGDLRSARKDLVPALDQGRTPGRAGHGCGLG